MATTRLAADARLRASETDQLEDLSPADRTRLQRAYEALAHELEMRAGIVPRAPRVAPVDPDQVPLFMVDREESRDEVLGEQAG